MSSKTPIGVWNRRKTVTPSDLLATWVAGPPGAATIGYGDAWLATNSSALLVVPSVIIHEESTILINPSRPDAKKITAAAVRQMFAILVWETVKPACASISIPVAFTPA